MSAFPTPAFAAPKLLRPTLDDEDQPTRAAAVDSLISQHRKATPPAVQNQRAAPRMSISEINAADIDALRERFSRTRVDDRGPVTKFLDIIDLPRNTIAGLLAPSIRRRKEAEGETATFGQGRVMFSDILDDMGVENRVIRGVAGFIGDVALDPLTYAGPAGWGVKGASAAGRTGQLTKRFASAAKEAVAASKVGREAADPLIRDYIRTAGFKSPGEVGTALFGQGRTRLNKAMRVIGGDIEAKGPATLLTDALDDVIHPLTPPEQAARIRAAKAVYDAYGRHNAPGLRIGRNAAGRLAVEAGSNPGTTIKAGTGYAHIPFTDISLAGPAITNRARMGIAAGQLARGVQTAGDMDPDLKAIDALTQTLNSRAEEVERGFKRQKELDGLLASGVVGVGPERTAISLRQAEVAEELPALVEEIAAKVRAIEAKPLSNPADILHAHKVFKANEANARRLMAESAMRGAEPGVNRARWDELRGEFDDEIEGLVRAKRDEHDAMNSAAFAASREPVDSDWPSKPLKYQKVEFDDAAARTQATREFRDAYRARLKPDDQAVFDMSPETLEAHDRFADAFHAKLAANVDLSTALQGPLDATLTSKDRSIADAAKMVLGLSPDDLGYTMFAPMRAVADSLSTDRDDFIAALAKGAGNRLANTDAALRKGFGRHSGKTHDLIRDYLRATSPLSNPMTTEIARAVGNDIRGLVENPAFNLSPANRVDLERLVGVLIDTLDKMPAQGDEAFKVIDDAAKAGLFSDAAHPGLHKAAMEVAQKWHQEIRNLGEMEVAAGQLGRLREGYGLPSLLSRETATRISNQKSFQAGFRGQPGGTGENLGKLVESFQKPRSTDRYVMPDGREFIDGERVFLSIGEDTLARMDPATAAEIKAIQKTINDFDKLSASQKPQPIPTSRAQINKWVKEDGRFKWLTGGALDGDFFETAASQAIASRFGSSYKSYLHNRLMEFAAQHGRAMDAERFKEYQATPDGATFKFNNGARGRLYKSPKGPILTVGDQRFRQINPDITMGAKFNPAQAITGDKHSAALWFPEEVADLIERANVPFREEGTIDAIIKGADEINRLWKTVTLFHPSWTIGDVVGGLYLSAFGGINVPGMVKRSKDAMRIVAAVGRKDVDALSKLNLEVAGRTINGLDVVRAEHSNALMGAGNAYEAAMQMLANGHLVPSHTWKLWKNPGKAVKEEWDRAGRFAEAEVHGREWTKAKGAQKGAAQARAFVNEGVMRRLVAPWFQLNGTINDVLRVSAYLSLMDEGYDAAQAARKVSETLFDMTTMTATEQNIRRLTPFYSWIKNSGAYGIRQLMENPRFFSIAPKVKHALEEAANGEDNLPEYQRPRWMRDQQAVLFGSGDTRQAALIGTLLPTDAAAYFATGLGSPVLGAQALQDAVSFFANSLSPVVKVPLELASHREWFTKREIGGDAGDLTIGEYLAGQVRPLKELGLVGVREGPIKAAFGRSVGEGVGRIALGGRLQPAGDERLAFHLQREQGEREKSLRKRVNLAERENAPEESLDTRAVLMRVFEDSMRKGVPLPKWAQEQLVQLTGAEPSP